MEGTKGVSNKMPTLRGLHSLGESKAKCPRIKLIGVTVTISPPQSAEGNKRLNVTEQVRFELGLKG